MTTDHDLVLARAGFADTHLVIDDNGAILAGAESLTEYGESAAAEIIGFVATDKTFTSGTDVVFSLANGLSHPRLVRGSTVIFRDSNSDERRTLARLESITDWTDEDEDEEDLDDECEGHESLAGAHMGETVYCDGSCR